MPPRALISTAAEDAVPQPQGIAAPESFPARRPLDGGAARSEPELRQLVAVAFRLALHWSKSRQDAEDIAQEAMLRLVLQPQVGRPSAWLAVVVRRLAWRLRRERVREGAALCEEQRRATASRPAVATEDRCTIAAALGRASSHDRQLLLLDAAGFSDEEIGRRLGCRARSVHTLLSRARGRLRRTQA